MITEKGQMNKHLLLKKQEAETVWRTEERNFIAKFQRIVGS